MLSVWEDWRMEKVGQIEQAKDGAEEANAERGHDHDHPRKYKCISSRPRLLLFCRRF